MIKRLDNNDRANNSNAYPDLASSKPRGGMQSVSRLVELLIKQYEIKDQIRQQQRRVTKAPIVEVTTSADTQATFAWYE